PFLAPHLPIVELHHERPDGRGYPFGLRGDDIPLDARIVHVADALDAMTSARAYRGARPALAAFAELQRFSGTQFDPPCVEAPLWVSFMPYERPGPVALRVEGRYLPSPVCPAYLALRPHMNPTIALPAELLSSIPCLEIRGPRINLLSGVCPLGVRATATAPHW